MIEPENMKVLNVSNNKYVNNNSNYGSSTFIDMSNNSQN